MRTIAAIFTASLLTAFAIPIVSADTDTGTSCGIGAGYTNFGQCSFWCEAGEYTHVYAINSGVASGGFATCPGSFVACESIGICERVASHPNTASGWGVCTAGVGAIQVQCWSR